MHAFYINLLRVCILSSVFLVTFIRTSIAQQTQTYPKIVGYFSAANPLATLSNGKITSNFGDVYTLNFLFGLNLIKSDKFGVSFEMAPSVRTENNISKVSSVAFSPGAIFRLPKDYAITQRVAFETSGRYGLTTVFNKILVKGKDASLFAAIPFGARFGNNAATTLTTSIQVGVFF